MLDKLNDVAEFMGSAHVLAAYILYTLRLELHGVRPRLTTSKKEM